MSLIDPTNLIEQAQTSPRQLELEEQVVQIIIDQLKSAELWKSTGENKLNFEQHFFDLGLEQLDLFEILIKLEDQFKLEIPDEDSVELTNINNIVDYLMQREALNLIF